MHVQPIFLTRMKAKSRNQSSQIRMAPLVNLGNFLDENKEVSRNGLSLDHINARVWHQDHGTASPFLHTCTWRCAKLQSKECGQCLFLLPPWKQILHLISLDHGVFYDGNLLIRFDMQSICFMHSLHCRCSARSAMATSNRSVDS